MSDQYLDYPVPDKKRKQRPWGGINEVRTPKYSTWTDSARHCDSVKSDCEKCTIWTHYGRHKAHKSPYKRCYMPKAVARLKALKSLAGKV